MHTHTQIPRAGETPSATITPLTQKQSREQQETAPVLQTRATTRRVLEGTLRMQQILERSRFARSDKRFSPPGPRSFVGMADKTIPAAPDVPRQKRKNKTAAEKVYRSITKHRSDEDSEPLQLLHPQVLQQTHTALPALGSFIAQRSQLLPTSQKRALPKLCREAKSRWGRTETNSRPRGANRSKNQHVKPWGWTSGRAGSSAALPDHRVRGSAP